MALTELEVRRINSYVTSCRSNGWSAASASAEFVNRDGAFTNSKQTLYYDRLDRFYSGDKGDGSAFDYLWFDPLFLDATDPAAGHINGAAQRRFILYPGEWDKVNNVQKIYGAVNSGSNLLTELDAAGSTPTLSNTGTWPHASQAQSPLFSIGIGATTDGYRINGDGAIVFFESAGFAIQASATVRDGGVNYDEVMARIDLTTGLSTIEAKLSDGFKISFRASPNIYGEPTLFGSDFKFENIQFIPDDDSVPATPKGRLFLSTGDNTGNLRFTGPLGPGSQVYVYVMMVEFNPFGIAATPGNPNRVHGRRELLSRYVVTEETEPESGGIGTSTSGDVNHQNAAWFHPPTNTILNFYETFNAGSNDIVLLRHSLSPVLNSISNPTATNETETNKTATFEVNASDDLGEPIENVSIDWTLQRASSFREALDTVGLPATSTVDNLPIDTGTLVVERDPGGGPVALVDGVDYTVVESTGVITWLGVHPNLEAGYSATYEHKTNPVNPPFGTLQTTLSRTNSNGVAQARVSYPDDDDLVGQWDAIDGSQST